MDEKVLAGKVVVVTGAGRGIGRDISLLAARHGAKVVVNDLGASPDGEGANRGPAAAVADEIEADGGEATVCAARFIEGMVDDDVVAIFNRDREVEYQEFVVVCRELEARWKAGAGRQLSEPALVAERDRLERRLEEILGRDYFAASQREDAMLAIEKLAVLDIADTSTN